MMTVRKCINGRELTRREREREAFLEEQRDVYVLFSLTQIRVVI